MFVKNTPPSPRSTTSRAGHPPFSRRNHLRFRRSQARRQPAGASRSGSLDLLLLRGPLITRIVAAARCGAGRRRACEILSAANSGKSPAGHLPPLFSAAFGDPERARHQVKSTEDKVIMKSKSRVLGGLVGGSGGRVGFRTGSLRPGSSSLPSLLGCGHSLLERGGGSGFLYLNFKLDCADKLFEVNQIVP